MPGPSTELLALAALALTSAHHTKVGWELVDYAIAIIQGPVETAPECCGPHLPGRPT